MKHIKSLAIILIASFLLIGCTSLKSIEEQSIDMLDDIKTEIENDTYYISVVDAGQRHDFYSYDQDNFIIIGYSIDEIALKVTCDSENNPELYLTVDGEFTLATEEEAAYWCEESTSFIGAIYDQAISDIEYGIENLSEDNYFGDFNGAYTYNIKLDGGDEVVSYSIYKKTGKVDISYEIDNLKITIESGEKSVPE